jgi:hypothetical protein
MTCAQRVVVVSVLVAAAVLLAPGAVAITPSAVAATKAPSIPPASLWAIEETMKTYGNRTITLPPAYAFLSWHQAVSVVPGHTGPDTVVEFSRDGRLAATWTATSVHASELALCGDLHGPSPTRYRVRGHMVYSMSSQHGRLAWICVADYAGYPVVYQLWDDHRFSWSQLATIVGTSSYRYVYSVSPFADFWTPSRNIGCLAVVPGQGLDPGGITCFIRSGLRPKPARRPADCRGAAFGWGRIVGLVLPQSGTSSGASEYFCADYEPVDTSARTLGYGHSMSFSGVTCTSMPSGLRCANAHGHGFFLSRQHSYLF